MVKNDIHYLSTTLYYDIMSDVMTFTECQIMYGKIDTIVLIRIRR